MLQKSIVGGQALIEGILMRSKNFYAIALRRKSGKITVNVERWINLSKRFKFLVFPFIRGFVALLESIMIGIKALTYSSDIYSLDYLKKEEDKNKIKINKKKSTNFDIIISILISFIFGILLFIVLPLFLTNLIKSKINISGFVYNIIDGFLRLVIFLLYVFFISLLKDVQRIFAYHGAEHKVVFTYENNEELMPQNAKKYSTLHPRCGTNFMFIVIIISILFISVLKFDSFISKLLVRILVLPIISNVSYEVLRFFGNYYNNKYIRIFFMPGLLLQKLTTREPDESQLEVAIKALNAVIAKEKLDTEETL